MTTLRLRELLNRRWSEIHLGGPAPYISVPHTKTGVPKKVPLPKVAVEALKRLPSYDVDEYVFPSRATARWRNPARPYRWDMGKEFRALVRRPLSPKRILAGWTGLEPATSDVTGRRSNQLNYHPARVAPGPVGGNPGGRYRIRTCDTRRVRPVLYR